MEFIMFFWFVAVFFYKFKKYKEKKENVDVVDTDPLAELFARANSLPATPKGEKLREKFVSGIGSLSWDSMTPNRSHPDFGRVVALQQVLPGKGVCFVLKLKRTEHKVFTPYSAELASQFKLV